MNKIVKLFLIVRKAFAFLVFNFVYHNTFLFVFQIRWNHVINPSYFQTVFSIILRCIHSVIFMDFTLNLTNLRNILVSQISIDRIGQSANQQILPEKIHHSIMGGFVKAFFIHEFPAYCIYCQLI